MLCYNVRLQYKAIKPEGIKKKNENEEESLEAKMVKLNSKIYSYTSQDDFFAVVYSADDDFLEFAVAVWPERISVSKVERIIVQATEKTYGAEGITVFPIEEITTKKYSEMLEEADDRDYVKRNTRKSGSDLDFDFYGNRYFKINEIITDNEKLNKKSAITRARKIMADRTLYEELERIYARGNARKFYGYPVHYCISSGNRDSGMEIIKLMIQMLYSQGRILSSRINLISQIKEGCYDETDLKNVCKHADGAAIVIDMRGSDGNHGNYARSYESVIRYLAELVEEYHSKTLFFFLEEIENSGFAKELLIKTEDYVDRIEIHEGTGQREEAMEYLHHLVKESNFSDLEDDSLGEYLQSERKTYRCYDVHVAFNKWSKEVLKSKAYSSYKECICIARTVEKKKRTVLTKNYKI